LNINADCVIGIQEVVYILQDIAELSRGSKIDCG
jgi:hypothetical protein